MKIYKGLLDHKNKILAVLGAALIGVFFVQPVLSQPSAMGDNFFSDKAFRNPDTVRAFYERRGNRLFWVRGAGAFQPRLDATLKILHQSWSHGLNPQAYNVSKIEGLLAEKTTLSTQKADMLLTDSVLHYVHDMTGMRGGGGGEKKLRYWRTPMGAEDIVAILDKTADPVAELRAIEPKGKLYQALRRELVALSALPDDSGFKPIKISGAIRPQKSNPKVPDIRARLGVPAPQTNPQIYDEALAVEVMKLQKANGVETDGVISGRTLEIINMKRADKIAQIVANMERLRWIDDGRPDRYILVNIPSASLWAVDGGEVKLEMPVIIGKTARPTYSFKTDITGVRFNPNWTVPPTIKKEDFLPALQQDPEILTKRGIRILYGGETVDPTTVDWTKVTHKGMSNLRMVQNPGDDNPLGKVRVIMENPFNIYLHDTNHREMFDKNDRALSSGCIRVSQPEKLADFILSKNEGWGWKGMEKIISSGRMRDVKNEHPLPVYIMYQTLWLDADGRLIYGRDVYGQDQKLFGMLQKSNSIHIPEHVEISEISL